MMPHNWIEKKLRYERKSAFIDDVIVGVTIGLVIGFFAWVSK